MSDWIDRILTTESEKRARIKKSQAAEVAKAREATFKDVATQTEGPFEGRLMDKVEIEAWLKRPKCDETSLEWDNMILEDIKKRRIRSGAFLARVQEVEAWSSASSSSGKK